MTQYDLQFVDGARLRVELSDEDWFKVFLSGRYKDGPLVQLARADDPSKSVTFEENLHAKAS